MGAPADRRVALVDEFARTFGVASLRRVQEIGTTGGVQLHHGYTDDGEHVFAKVVRINPLMAYDVDDLGRAARETGFLRLHDVANCPEIVPLRFAGIGNFPDLGTVHVRVFPFADGGSLSDRLHAGLITDATGTSEDVRGAVSAALVVLHGLKIAHCDVAPNNILLVDGGWRLADLDRATEFGRPLTGVADDPYRLPGAYAGQDAEATMDLYGLDQVAARIDGAGRVDRA